MKCCFQQRNSKDEGFTSHEEKSKYDNPLLIIFFPLAFFSVIVGVTFLLWPINFDQSVGDDKLTDIFIVGIFLTSVAAVSGILTLVTVCYIHVKSFDRKKLPTVVLDYTRSDRGGTIMDQDMLEKDKNLKRNSTNPQKGSAAKQSASYSEASNSRNLTGIANAANFESRDNCSVTFQIGEVSLTDETHPTVCVEAEVQETYM
ncbi:uncharacterized protein [Watersipora subatra]|uniref:uncharacterized protein n=1 Tax=Watersipora subatra TaxID=2589382 RepID=UPI00355B80F6